MDTVDISGEAVEVDDCEIGDYICMNGNQIFQVDAFDEDQGIFTSIECTVH